MLAFGPATRALFATALLATSVVAHGAISLQLPANYDDTRTTEYPNGDKPISGATCPTGWTCAVKGDGVGEIDEISASSFTVVASGTNDEGNIVYAYKTCASGDCQVQAIVPATWSGHLETYTSFGVGITEGTGDSAYYCQATYFDGTSGARCKCGTPGPDEYTATSTSGIGRPLALGITDDKSADEVRCLESADGISWSTFGTHTKALANNSLGYVYGNSHDVANSTSATLTGIEHATTIDLYTPSDPGGGGPSLVTPIANQSPVQGVAFSLDVSVNFSGETSYTADLPAGTGITFNTSTGVFGGTPDADDVTASPYNVETCGVNVGGTTCDLPQFTVSAVPGDVLVVAIGTDEVDCDTYESGGRVDAGDILQIDDGVRGPLEIRDCDGTPDNPIIIRNDPAGTAAATIRRTSGTAPALNLLNMTDFVMDGTGKWTGAPAGTCGYNETTGAIGTTNCGIVVETQGGAGGFVIRLAGLSCAGSVDNPNSVCTIKGVTVDGNNVSGIGLSMNDHTELFHDNDGGAGTDDDLWRENLLVESSYFVDIGNGVGEAMYVGPNQDAVAPDLALRDITIRRNYIIGSERDCINTKSVLDGFLLIEYNYMTGCGESDESTQNRGLNLNGAADYTIRGNVILNTGGEGMLVTWQDIASLSPNGSNTFDIVNNIIADVGQTAGAQRRDGIRFTRNSDSPTYNGNVSNNTLATVPEEGFSCGSNVTVNLRNNILAGVVGDPFEGTGCNDQNSNAEGTVNSFNFANAGADNYELTSSSASACNLASATYAPSTDYEGEARPQDSADDIGADENTACP